MGGNKKRSFWEPMANMQWMQKSMHKLVNEGLETTLAWMERTEMPDQIQYMIKTLNNVWPRNQQGKACWKFNSHGRCPGNCPHQHVLNDLTRQNQIMTLGYAFFGGHHTGPRVKDVQQVYEEMCKTQMNNLKDRKAENKKDMSADYQEIYAGSDPWGADNREIAHEEKVDGINYLRHIGIKNDSHFALKLDWKNISRDTAESLLRLIGMKGWSKMIC